MKIVVPIKKVASLDDEFELRDDERDVDPGDIDWDLNEWDSFSVEAALLIHEAQGEGEVVAVSVGDDDADDALRECLARGVHRAVRVWDDALEDADPLTIARTLAAVVRREEADLVLCGVQSSDGAHGVTGVALAALLDLPRVATVRRIELEAEGRSAVVERELEGGVVQRLRVGLPALLTIQTGINEPRYATLRAIKQAAAKPIDELDLADLGLDADELSASAGFRVRRMSRPEAGRRAELVDGDAAEIAARIAEIVKEKLSA
jgi:electron transfer flavoprotein beta subunit